jgi:hypothetical protein
MLTFIIPLQSQTVAKCWDKTCQLFERCLKSVCRQTDEFQAIVICHELPNVSFQHPQVTYVQADFPPPKLVDLSQKEQCIQKDTDKGRKLLLGLAWAQARSASHVMFVDADDCISSRLASFVKQRPEANGWFLTKGYRLQEGESWIYRKSHFYRMCGTCNIVRTDLLQIPAQPEFNRGYGYYKHYIDHAKLPGWLQSAGTPLEPLPFPGAVYIVGTGENIYFDASRLQKNILRFLNYRLLTKSLQQEFGLYSLSGL